MRSVHVFLLAAASLGSAALAAGPDARLLSVATPGAAYAPTHYARFNAHTGEIGKFKPMPNGSVADTSGCGGVLFDTFEVDDPTLRLDPNTGQGGPQAVGGQQCGLPTSDSRWFIAEGFDNPWVIEDMQAVTPGIFSEYLMLAVKIEPEAPGEPVDLTVLITVYEDFDPNCGGLPQTPTDPLGGFIFKFDPIQVGNGLYTTLHFDLCGSGDGFLFPADGKGAWEARYLISGSSRIQPMLWGASNNFPSGGPRVGEQGPKSYNDFLGGNPPGTCPPVPVINNPDGQICVPEECRDNALGVCPNPLAAMALFLGLDESGLCPSDLNSDGVTNDSDLGLLLDSFNQSSNGDVDGDGDTDDGDLGLLLDQFNQPCPI